MCENKVIISTLEAQCNLPLIIKTELLAVHSKVLLKSFHLKGSHIRLASYRLGLHSRFESLRTSHFEQH